MGQILARALAKSQSASKRKSAVAKGPSGGAWKLGGGTDMKIVVVGSGGVGKSSVTLQFVHNAFPEDYDPTIEDNFRKQVVVDEDTAGQEEFACMKDQWVRGGEGFVLVYSITDRQSFDDIHKHRDFILKVKDADKGPMVLVANKSDLEADRQVSTVEGSTLAQSYGLKFLEVSAKNRVNIDETFQTLVREVRRYSSGGVA